MRRKHLNNKSFRNKTRAEWFERNGGNANLRGDIIPTHFKRTENVRELNSTPKDFKKSIIIPQHGFTTEGVSTGTTNISNTVLGNGSMVDVEVIDDPTGNSEGSVMDYSGVERNAVSPSIYLGENFYLEARLYLNLYSSGTPTYEAQAIWVRVENNSFIGEKTGKFNIRNGSVDVTGSIDMPLQTWFNLGVLKIDSTYHIYFNDVYQESINSSANNGQQFNSVIFVGFSHNSSFSEPFNGYIKNFTFSSVPLTISDLTQVGRFRNIGNDGTGKPIYERITDDIQHKGFSFKANGVTRLNEPDNWTGGSNGSNALTSNSQFISHFLVYIPDTMLDQGTQKLYGRRNDIGIRIGTTSTGMTIRIQGNYRSNIWSYQLEDETYKANDWNWISVYRSHRDGEFEDTSFSVNNTAIKVWVNNKQVSNFVSGSAGRGGSGNSATEWTLLDWSHVDNGYNPADYLSLMVFMSKIESDGVTEIDLSVVNKIHQSEFNYHSIKTIYEPNVDIGVYCGGDEQPVVDFATPITDDNPYDDNVYIVNEQTGFIDSDIIVAPYSIVNDKGYNQYNQEFYEGSHLESTFVNQTAALSNMGSGDYGFATIIQMPLILDNGVYDIASDSNGASSNIYFYNAGNGRIGVIQYFSGTNANYVSDIDLRDGLEHEVIFSFDSSLGRGTIYIDGVESTYSSRVDAVGTPINNNNPWVIGKYTASAPDRNFIGFIKNPRFYNVQITPINIDSFTPIAQPIANEDGSAVSDEYGSTWTTSNVFDGRIVAASIQFPEYDIKGFPLEYKGKLAPRAQIVDSAALQLNGVDQYVQSNNNSSVPLTGEFKITWRGKINSIGSSIAIWSQAYNASGGTGICLYLMSNGTLELWREGARQVDGTIVLNTTEYYTIIFGRDSSNVVYLEVNGLRENGITNSESLGTVADPWQIGRNAFSQGFYAATDNIEFKVEIGNNIELHYVFAEEGGTIIYDVSGNNNHGTVINASLPSNWTTQPVFAWNFYEGYTPITQVEGNGVDQWASIASQTGEINGFSLFAKIYYDGTNSNFFFTLSNTSSSQARKLRFIINSSGAIYVRWRGGASYLSRTDYYMNTGMSVGWHDVFITFDPTNGVNDTSSHEIYVDGILQAKTQDLVNGGYPGNSGAGYTYTIGRELTNIQYFKIDKLIFWEGAVVPYSERENSQYSASNVICHYEFDEGSGNEFVDLGDTSNNATITAATDSMWSSYTIPSSNPEVKGYKNTGKWNGSGKLKFPEIPEIPKSIRGKEIPKDNINLYPPSDIRYIGNKILLLEEKLTQQETNREGIVSSGLPEGIVAFFDFTDHRNYNYAPDGRLESITDLVNGIEAVVSESNRDDVFYNEDEKALEMQISGRLKLPLGTLGDLPESWDYFYRVNTTTIPSPNSGEQNYFASKSHTNDVLFTIKKHPIRSFDEVSLDSFNDGVPENISLNNFDLITFDTYQTHQYRHVGLGTGYSEFYHSIEATGTTALIYGGNTLSIPTIDIGSRAQFPNQSSDGFGSYGFSKYVVLFNRNITDEERQRILNIIES